MPVNYNELIEAAEIVAEKNEMKVTLKYSFGGAAVTACTSLVGGLCGGPIGLGIGGVVGSVAAAVYTKGKYKSVLQIIKEDLSELEKIKLAEHIQRAVQDLQITDLAKLIFLVRSNEVLCVEIFKALTYFLEHDMGYRSLSN